MSTMDEKSGYDDDVPAQTKRRVLGTLEKLHTADITIVNQITCLHKVLYKCSGEPAVYKELGSMAFINGYITVMAKEPEHIKSRMLLHLQELMEDGEAYGQVESWRNIGGRPLP